MGDLFQKNNSFSSFFCQLWTIVRMFSLWNKKWFLYEVTWASNLSMLDAQVLKIAITVFYESVWIAPLTLK